MKAVLETMVAIGFIIAMAVAGVYITKPAPEQIGIAEINKRLDNHEQLFKALQAVINTHGDVMMRMHKDDVMAYLRERQDQLDAQRLGIPPNAPTPYIPPVSGRSRSASSAIRNITP